MDKNSLLPAPRRSAVLAAAVLALLAAPGGVSRSQAPAPRLAPLPLSAVALLPARPLPVDCAARAVEIVAERTRRRLAEILPGTGGDPAAVAAAMAADPRAAEAVAGAFAGDGMLKTDSAPGRGCVMTERRTP